jgi:hypothetical protein
VRRAPLWIAAALLAIAAAGLAWWSAGTSGKQQSRVQSQPPLDATNGPQSGSVATPPAQPTPTISVAAPRKPEPADPIGGALDLKRVFDEYAASADARGRRVAARAFSACFPAFLPANAQTPSPEPLIRALPAQQRTEREASYWALFARCRGFLGDGRTALEDTQKQLQGSPESEEPGWRAQEDLLAGRTDRIDALVSRGLSASDPAAVAAMSGVAGRLAAVRNAEASNADLSLRARAVDAALPLVACDLGLDCSAGALPSLQLCAAEGVCEGDLATRIAKRNADNVDVARIQEQRVRLLALIRSGRALTAADLLP